MIERTDNWSLPEIRRRYESLENKKEALKRKVKLLENENAVLKDTLGFFDDFGELPFKEVIDKINTVYSKQRQADQIIDEQLAKNKEHIEQQED